MIEELKPYDNYRPTGLDVAPRTPSHWATLPIGRIGRFLRGKGGTKKDNADNGVPCIRYGDIYKHFAFHVTRTHSFVHQDVSSRYTKLRRGDVVFALSGEIIDDIGASAEILLDGDVVGGGDMAILRPARENAPGFLGYALRAAPTATQKAREGTGTTVKHTSISALRGVLLAMPPPDEQAAIVRFLDHANRCINRFIRAKKKLIALLNEQKPAILHQAVTRGLDPNVTFKKTGVPWVSEMPAHWQLTPNRAHLRVRKVLVGSRHPEFQLLSLTKRGVIIRDLSGNKGKFSSDMGTSQEVRAGDLVFCLFDVPETPRTVGLSSHNGMITGAYTIMECGDPSIARFLEAFYIAMDDSKLLSPLYSGLRNTIPKDRLLGAKTPIPPAGERERILSFIAKEMRAIQAGIDRTSAEIALVQEYRSRLVADVVTGQLDVRAASASLPIVEPEAARTESEGDETNIEDGEAA